MVPLHLLMGLPSSQQKKNAARLAHLNTDIGNAQSPWGWSGTGGARHANLIKERKPTHHRPKQPSPRANPNEKTPWGWPGSDGLHASNMEILSEGIEKSAAVTSVKKMMHVGDKSADTGHVDWPYRKSEKKAKPARSQRSRYVGTMPATGKDKPWGW